MENTPRIIVFDYDQNQFQKITPQDINECQSYKNTESQTWIDIDSARSNALVVALGKTFNLHPLVIEDIANPDQRPKMEDYGDYVYLSLNMIRYNHGANAISSEKISIILFSHLVISFQEGTEGDVFDKIRERIQGENHRIRKMGTDYLVYSLIDAVIDQYFIVLENIGEEVESLEEKLLANPDPKTISLLHKLKREMVYLRKSVWPLREVIGNLEHGESSLVTSGTMIYLRDAYNHTVQVIDTIETYRDILSGMIDIYLSSINNHLNEVMKVLTIISTIFIPLTFIAGVYGMNFHFMPELSWHYGYHFSLIIMAVVATILLIFFKKKRWF